MPTWDPDRYGRFAAERKQPFDDLVAWCQTVAGGVVYDLGCGPGHLTVELAHRVGARLAVGIDSSDAMLERARAHATGSGSDPAIEFRRGDLAWFAADRPADLIFANASLHWVDAHPAVLARWRANLADGGQLAVQVPANHEHPVYRMATAVAAHHPHLFRGGRPPPMVTTTVLAPEAYAEVLYDLGCRSPLVAVRIYCHELDTPDEAVEWIRGTSLLRYEEAARDEAAFGAYLELLRQGVRNALGDRHPYLFTFRRILMWARY